MILGHGVIDYTDGKLTITLDITADTLSSLIGNPTGTPNQGMRWLTFCNMIQAVYTANEFRQLHESEFLLLRELCLNDNIWVSTTEDATIPASFNNIQPDDNKIISVLNAMFLLIGGFVADISDVNIIKQHMAG